MHDRYRLWYWLLPAILLSRLATMVLFPLVDTTEPRYAEIARLMLESGDWITPWFAPGTPFWGKPPLSFWAQALAMKVFGVNELAVRLPSWLAMGLTTGLVIRFASMVWGKAQGILSALVLLSMGLAFISAGAVMTDPFLLLGTTLSLLCFAEVMVDPSRGRSARWLFFVGLVIGLLAKGPLTLILVGLPIFLWTLLERQWPTLWERFPWFRGGLLTLILAVPWYIAAELKTPGFIDYFIVGEHFRRFLDPGWQGDLYGSAHERPHGMIWVFWLWATFPWGLVILAAFLWSGARRRAREVFQASSTVRFLLYAGLSPLMFFTMSGNTLWTYVLPALPFFALSIGHLIFRGADVMSTKRIRVLALGAAIVPALITAAGLYVAVDEEVLAAEKTLIAHYRSSRDTMQSPLYYLDEVPFSARFYLREDVGVARLGQLAALGERNKPYFIAVRSRRINEVEQEIDGVVGIRYKGDRHTLLEITPGLHEEETAGSTESVAPTTSS